MPTDFKFASMWDRGYRRRPPRSNWGCWNWGETAGGDASRFFRETLEGATCNRNWLQGAMGGRNDRPFWSGSPALLGFDESINEWCSSLLGKEAWDQGDLNSKIANRCRDAHRNVLRVLTGGWSMCTNLQWQLCAITGKLPGQESPKISFATAPKDLKLEWWTDPGRTHPTYPCRGDWCDPNGFSVGDVYFAEVAVTSTICRNRGALFDLEVGELFECDLDREAYARMAAALQAA